jgi:hypothetical protein
MTIPILGRTKLIGIKSETQQIDELKQLSSFKMMRGELSKELKLSELVIGHHILRLTTPTFHGCE